MRPAFLALMVAFLVVLPVFPAAAETPTATAIDPRFGAVEAFRAPEQSSSARVGWQRVLFWWYGLQPNGPGDWNEHYFPDSIVQSELAGGRTIVGCILNPPQWANGTGRPVDPPKNLYLPFDHPENYWGQFVRRIAERYKGRIDHWIIGNEPDIWDPQNPGFTWNGSPADYYQFLKIAYQAAKAANPNAKVGMAGLTYWWDKEYGRQQYFERLLVAARADPTAAANDWYFDFASLQLYNDPQALYDVPKLFRELMARNGVAEKPIWITETNVPPWNEPADPLPRERFRASLDEQAAYIIQALAYGIAAGLPRIAVYKMADSPDLPSGVERYGLVRADGSARPAYQAFQVATKYFAGARGGTVSREAGTVRITLDAGDQAVTVIWNAGAQARTATVPASGSSATLVDQRGETREIQAQNGAFSLALPPATANTIPGAPNEYRIGGPPFLVVQPRPAVPLRQIPLAPEYGLEGDRWIDAVTGHAVSGPWLAAYRSLGGLDNLGHARSGVFADPLAGGRPSQYFQRAVLEYHPENQPPYQIQRRLLGDILDPGAEPPLAPSDGPGGPATYFPAEAGLGHFVADYTRSGRPVYFKEYFDAHGGLAAFGYPKEEPKMRAGFWTQRFQAAVFEYHPEHDRDGVIPGTAIPYRNFRVQLALLGDEYGRLNGLW